MMIAVDLLLLRAGGAGRPRAHSLRTTDGLALTSHAPAAMAMVSVRQMSGKVGNRANIMVSSSEV
jgi:hypothetical protein